MNQFVYNLFNGRLRADKSTPKRIASYCLDIQSTAHSRYERIVIGTRRTCGWNKQNGIWHPTGPLKCSRSNVSAGRQFQHLQDGSVNHHVALQKRKRAGKTRYRSVHFLKASSILRFEKNLRHQNGSLVRDSPRRAHFTDLEDESRGEISCPRVFFVERRPVISYSLHQCTNNISGGCLSHLNDSNTRSLAAAR